MNAGRCWFFTFLASLPIFFASIDAQADHNPPTELGSIRDPDDLPPSQRPKDWGGKSILELSDEEMPEIPEALRWELALATKAYSISKTLRTASDLITVLSKGVEKLCFNELQKKLSYYPPPDDPGCKKLLSLLTDIDTDNPLIACVNTGIDTDECRKAFLTQKTASTIPSEITSAYLRAFREDEGHMQFENDLKVKIEVEKMTNKIGEIRRLIDGANTRLESKNPTSEERRDLLEKRTQYLTELLEVSCSSYRIVAFPKSFAKDYQNTTLPPPRPIGGGKTGSLEELLNKGPFNEQLIAAKKAVPITRFRIVSQTCQQNIEWVESKFPQLAALPCIREGVTSPNCIQARRANGGTGSPQTSSGTNTGGDDGLERF